MKTFNYYFWTRVTVHPEENSEISKQIDLDDYHPLRNSLSDTHPDDFYERFMERRAQKLTDPKEIVTENLFLFPIVPLLSAPTALPTK